MWESLKRILQDSNERVVIVEDGEPRYVLLSVTEYMRLRATSRTEGLSAYRNDGTNTEQGYTPPTSTTPPVANTDFETPITAAASEYNPPFPIQSSDVNEELSQIPKQNTALGETHSTEISLEDLPF